MFDVKQIQKMQKELQDRMGKVQEELKTKTIEASAGGGMVTAVANGNQELVGIKIKPDAVDLSDLEMLEDLVVAAVNLALEKAKGLNQEEYSKITGGLKIPGLF
ncbi:MAG: YbaB/EbfC family nucleoid-associated protein [Candidatus Sumerlaeaceae bacterium]|nr:YbaB/EbfC family nucleoid-associated protein [Candidatus Sumerlaeaceae bacterium]